MDLLKSLVFLIISANSVLGNAHDFNKTTQFTEVVPASDSSEPIYITPGLLFVGKTNGQILRCLYNNPSVCELFYAYVSPIGVTSIAISGEYLFASLANGIMLKCNLHEKTCTDTNSLASAISSLAVSDGYIFAGLQDGRMMRCAVHQWKTCEIFKKFLSSVTSLGATDRYVYVGLLSKELWRCTVGSKESCRVIDTAACASPVTGITAVDETVIAVTKTGTFWNCTRNVCTNTDYTRAPDTQFVNLAAFDASLYALHNTKILLCKFDSLGNCSFYEKHEGALSISFAYSTYKMQERFVNEEKTCLTGARCPPFIIYYENNQRSMLEVFVKGGKLYNSQNVLVDTSDADVGQSGRAAIFAMGANGQILLSNVHSSHDSVLRSSSLFAGQPVAGAGEMVVDNGVIKTVRACSDHYRPTVELNRQVIDALRLKGYTGRIDNLPCCKQNECRQVDAEGYTVDDEQ